MRYLTLDALPLEKEAHQLGMLFKSDKARDFNVLDCLAFFLIV